MSSDTGDTAATGGKNHRQKPFEDALEYKHTFKMDFPYRVFYSKDVALRFHGDPQIKHRYSIQTLLTLSQSPLVSCPSSLDQGWTRLHPFKIFGTDRRERGRDRIATQHHSQRDQRFTRDAAKTSSLWTELPSNEQVQSMPSWYYQELEVDSGLDDHSSLLRSKGNETNDNMTALMDKSTFGENDPGTMFDLPRQDFDMERFKQEMKMREMGDTLLDPAGGHLPPVSGQEQVDHLHHSAQDAHGEQWLRSSISGGRIHTADDSAQNAVHPVLMAERSRFGGRFFRLEDLEDGLNRDNKQSTKAVPHENSHTTSASFNPFPLNHADVGIGSAIVGGSGLPFSSQQHPGPAINMPTSVMRKMGQSRRSSSHADPFVVKDAVSGPGSFGEREESISLTSGRSPDMAFNSRNVSKTGGTPLDHFPGLVTSVNNDGDPHVAARPGGVRPGEVDPMAQLLSAPLPPPTQLTRFPPNPVLPPELLGPDGRPLPPHLLPPEVLAHLQKMQFPPILPQIFAGHELLHARHDEEGLSRWFGNLGMASGVEPVRQGDNILTLEEIESRQHQRQ